MRMAFASATFASSPRSADARIHSTSAPAQKLGPSPASTTARAAPTSTKASDSSVMSASNAARRRPGKGGTEDVSVSLDAERAHDAQPKVSPDGSEALHGAAGTVQKTATMFRVPFDSEVASAAPGRPSRPASEPTAATSVERVHEGRPLN